MKFNGNLWNKFVKKRLYAFDLIHVVDGNDEKVLRFVNGMFCDSYKNNSGGKSEIPDVNSPINLQIHVMLSRFKMNKAFIKSREICQNHPNKFKITYSLLIKELR